MALGIPIGVLASAAPRKPLGTGVRRILVIRLDLLGDVALSLPAIRSLRAAYPEARIDMVVRPAALAIARACPAIDGVLTFDPDKLRPSGEPFSRAAWADLMRITRSLRGGGYDVAVSLFGAWGSLLALASGAPVRVGYRSEGFPNVFTRPVPGKRYKPPKHEARYGLRLAHAAGGVIPGDEPALFARPEDIAAARHTLLGEAEHNHVPIVVCSPGSAGGSAKRWTEHGWSELIQWLAANGAAVSLIGSDAERDMNRRIADQAGVPLVNLTGLTTLASLLGVLSAADVVVSGDTGPLHIAEALGRPVVAIMGPSDPRISGPQNVCWPVVRLPLSCSPCYDGTYSAECPLGHHRCMRDLSSLSVAKAVQEILSLPLEHRP